MMYKPGSVLDFLNKNNSKDIEDSAISKLFKDETELSQIFHRNKIFEAHKNEDEKEQHNTSITSNPLIGEEDDEDDDEEEEEEVMKLSNAGRRIDAKSHKEMLKSRGEQDTRTAFVGNVSLDATKKDLLELFKKCGKVESIRFRSVPTGDIKLPKKAVAIKKAYHPRGKSMNAYVVFKQAEMVQEALKLNNTQLHGIHLRVDSAANDKRICHDRSIFVGNLSYSCDEESLRRLFEGCGEVEGVRVVRDRKTLIGKGFAYVTFKEEASVELALRMDACELKGRKLRVQRSVEEGVGEKKMLMKGVGGRGAVKKGLGAKGVVKKRVGEGREVASKKRRVSGGVTSQGVNRTGRAVVNEERGFRGKGSMDRKVKNGKERARNTASKTVGGKPGGNKVVKSSNEKSKPVKSEVDKSKSKKRKFDEKNDSGKRKSTGESSQPAPKKKAIKESGPNDPGQAKNRKKEALKKKQNFLEKKNERSEKKKKVKKVIKQEVLKRKKAKLGEILSKH